MDRADSHHQHPAPDEVGRLLAETREAFGLSVADVAAQLRLSTRQVEALETEDYERLPGKTFTRGFVRNYARLLQMDPEPLMAALEQALPRSRVSDILPKTENIPFSTGKADGWRRYLLLLSLLVLVIPLVLFQAYRDSSAPTTSFTSPAPAPVAVPPVSAPPAAEPAPAPAPPGGATEPAASSGAALPSGQSPAEPAQAENPPPPRLDAQPEPAASAPAPAPGPVAPGAATLRFRFAQESWVEVRDLAGQVVATQLNRADSEWTVQVKPPVALVVGNAAGVTLERNGESVALSPRSGSGVARLTLE
jgi:cytoskeleton protein RodZ